MCLSTRRSRTIRRTRKQRSPPLSERLRRDVVLVWWISCSSSIERFDFDCQFREVGFSRKKIRFQQQNFCQFHARVIFQFSTKTCSKRIDWSLLEVREKVVCLDFDDFLLMFGSARRRFVVRRRSKVEWLITLIDRWRTSTCQSTWKSTKAKRCYISVMSYLARLNGNKSLDELVFDSFDFLFSDCWFSSLRICWIFFINNSLRCWSDSTSSGRILWIDESKLSDCSRRYSNSWTRQNPNENSFTRSGRSEKNEFNDYFGSQNGISFKSTNTSWSAWHLARWSNVSVGSRRSFFYGKSSLTSSIDVEEKSSPFLATNNRNRFSSMRFFCRDTAASNR